MIYEQNTCFKKEKAHHAISVRPASQIGYKSAWKLRGGLGTLDHLGETF